MKIINMRYKFSTYKFIIDFCEQQSPCHRPLCHTGVSFPVWVYVGPYPASSSSSFSSIVSREHYSTHSLYKIILWNDSLQCPRSRVWCISHSFWHEVQVLALSYNCVVFHHVSGLFLSPLLSWWVPRLTMSWLLWTVKSMWAVKFLPAGVSPGVNSFWEGGLICLQRQSKQSSFTTLLVGTVITPTLTSKSFSDS